MTTTAAPRFNTQKDEFSINIKRLQTTAESLSSELRRGGNIKNVKRKILEFAGNVNNLVEDLTLRISSFAELAFSISSELDDVYQGVSKKTWLENANKLHNEGIFQWMHEQILGLLTQRWNKLNLGSIGDPDTPPNYTQANFKNYNEIISTQNNKKRSINNNRGELMSRLEPISKKLENLADKVTPKSNQAGPSQP